MLIQLGILIGLVVYFGVSINARLDRLIAAIEASPSEDNHA